jgi:hypothetical protein
MYNDEHARPPIYMENQECMDVEMGKIVYPDECPKCRCHNILCSEWKDGQYLFLSLYCQECNFFWRETIDLDI